ncbi:MAG: PmoA family protein [Planctomycetaceae bacterium]|nr:PmoA family protein [Planctomycetaceae bacterium]
MTNKPTRYEIVPQANQEASFQVDGVEKLRWHFGKQAPRPFFYPFCGPSNVSLTRIGHPGVGNHDHHRSVWFAHHKVLGINFWSDNTEAVVRQREWLRYRDGQNEASMAVKLDWFDGHNPTPLLTQDLIVGFRLHADGGTLLELQSTFTPQADQLEFGQTNFGFLAVRVAKSISTYFGQGIIQNDAGVQGEKNLFEKTSSWMDYSGPIPVGTGKDRRYVTEGITYYDHPGNISYPTRWHVREDGWMGASACGAKSILITKEKPLTLRYLLHAHPGPADLDRQKSLNESFAKSPKYVLNKATTRHTQWEIERQK